MANTLCQSCGYDVSGLPGFLCPECGRTISIKPVARGLRWPTVLFMFMTLGMGAGVIAAGHGAGMLWMFWGYFGVNEMILPPVLTLVAIGVVCSNRSRDVRGWVSAGIVFAWVFLVVDVMSLVDPRYRLTFLTTAAVGIIGVAGLSVCACRDLWLSLRR
jgi:hypothetical protein